MPNHVMNELVIDAPLSTVAPLALDGEGRIDFEVLLPLPLNFWNGNVGSDHKAVFPGDGLSWSTANWGTKWNAYGQDDEAEHYASVVECDGKTVLTFQTAWSPPMGWVAALFNKLHCNMLLTWLDEGRDDAMTDHFWFVDDGWNAGPNWERKRAEEGETERLKVFYWGAEVWERIKAEEAEEAGDA